MASRQITKTDRILKALRMDPRIKNEEIAKRFDLSVRTVQRTLNDLTEKGVIDVEVSGGSRSVTVLTVGEKEEAQIEGVLGTEAAPAASDAKKASKRKTLDGHTVGSSAERELCAALCGAGLRHRTQVLYSSLITGYVRKHSADFTVSLNGFDRPIIVEYIGKKIDGNRENHEAAYVEKSRAAQAAGLIVVPLRSTSEIITLIEKLKARQDRGPKNEGTHRTVEVSPNPRAVNTSAPRGAASRPPREDLFGRDFALHFAVSLIAIRTNLSVLESSTDLRTLETSANKILKEVNGLRNGLTDLSTPAAELERREAERQASWDASASHRAVKEAEREEEEKAKARAGAEWQEFQTFQREKAEKSRAEIAKLEAKIAAIRGVQPVPLPQPVEIVNDELRSEFEAHEIDLIENGIDRDSHR